MYPNHPDHGEVSKNLHPRKTNLSKSSLPQLFLGVDSSVPFVMNSWYLVQTLWINPQPFLLPAVPTPSDPHPFNPFSPILHLYYFFQAVVFSPGIKMSSPSSNINIFLTSVESWRLLCLLLISAAEKDACGGGARKSKEDIFVASHLSCNLFFSSLLIIHPSNYPFIHQYLSIYLSV